MATATPPDDPFKRLRPLPPTPAQELCACTGEPPVTLRSVLAPNPIGCLNCNLEVPPERIGFPRQLADALAYWVAFHDCFFFLWLDSAEFEDWARAQLEAPNSPVNRRGMSVASELSAYRKCYYWWFASTDEDYIPPATCLVCGGALQDIPRGLTCEHCQILYSRQ